MEGVTATKVEFISIKRVFSGEVSTLNNHAVRANMPAVYIEGEELKREQHIIYLGIIFDTKLCGSGHITRAIGKARRAFVALKTMAGAKDVTENTGDLVG